MGALCEPLLLQPHPLLPHGFLHDCMWRFALHDAHGLQGYSLLHCGPLLSFRELLLHLWTTSCPPSALTLMAAGLFLSHFSLSSPSCCCPAVFPFLKSALPEHTQHHLWLMSGSGRSLLEQLELVVIWHEAVLGSTRRPPLQPLLNLNLAPSAQCTFAANQTALEGTLLLPILLTFIFNRNSTI